MFTFNKMQFITIIAFSLTLPLLGIVKVASEIIPYSYATGRNVETVERRYQAFKAAKSSGASTDVLNNICGPIANHRTQCALAGRPSDDATMFCDSMCCLNGNKVGNCGKIKLEIKPNWPALLSSLTSNNTMSALKDLNVKLVNECSCSDDAANVRCGPDGSFLGIRCPFDNSACWRKCCRQGKNSGKCKWFKCKCK